MRMSTAFVCFGLCVFLSSLEVIAQPATPGVSLKAKPTLITKIEDIIVSWSNVLQPSPEDFIELFYANYNSSIARAQKQVSGESSGFVVFQDLVNSRLDYQFRYVSKIAGVVVVSDLVRVDVNYPVQAHLSLTHDFTKMRLMWVSGTKEEPVVVYGVKSGNYSERVYATTHTYTVQDFLRYENGSITKAVDNFIPPGYIHDAILTHIRPNEKYYYVFGSEDGFSEEFTFTGPPKPGTQTEVKFIMVADSGTGLCSGMTGWCEEASLNTTTLALDDIDKDGYNFVLHVGDISYAVGDAWRWDQFFTQIEPLAATVPYMVTIGNHEYDYTYQPFLPKWADFLHDSYGEAGVVYNNKFHMPGPDPAVVSSQNNNYDSNNNDNLWYSFEYGGAHFTVLSNEHDFLPGSEQYNWLVKDLGSVDRERTPFLIVAAHRPMYCSAQMFFDNIFSTHIQQALDDLLYQHKVDVYLGGHFHLYERTCKMYQYKCVSDGVMHIVAGMGGQDLELTWQKPQPDWSLFRGDEYGYTRFHITNSTALHVQYVLNSNHTVADDFWLYK